MSSVSGGIPWHVPGDASGFRMYQPRSSNGRRSCYWILSGSHEFSISTTSCRATSSMSTTKYAARPTRFFIVFFYLKAMVPREFLLYLPTLSSHYYVQTCFLAAPGKKSRRQLRQCTSALVPGITRHLLS